MFFGEGGPEENRSEENEEQQNDRTSRLSLEITNGLTAPTVGIDHLPKGSLLEALSKKPGEDYKKYLERLWTAKIKRVSDDDTKGDCVAIREHLKKQPREIIVFSELMAMAKDELRFLKASFSNTYFNKIDEKTFLAFFVNEMIDRSLTPLNRVKTYKTFLIYADVAKVPSRDQSASFGLAQTIKETYYGVAGKYNSKLPAGRKLPEKFKECVKARDQLRLAILLAYGNVVRIGLAVEKNIGLKRLFDAASPKDQQRFLTAMLARAHNAGPKSVNRVMDSLKNVVSRLKNLNDCLPYTFKNSEIKDSRTGEKRTLVDGVYAKGAVDAWEVL